MDCKCGQRVPPSHRLCPACGKDCGSPNVRLAQAPEEVTALDDRVRAALIDANTRGSRTQLLDFANAVTKSRAVIARSLGDLDDLLAHDYAIYTSHQRQVNARTKVPRDNKFDYVRQQFEAALFPNFHEEILFGCLTLTDSGMSAYGDYSMILRDDSIASRTTVFEENPYNFAQNHQILLNQPIPPGFRSDWDNRVKLAIAKLHQKISASTSRDEYASILMLDLGDTADGDFMEVHIHGTLTRRSIEIVSGPAPKDRSNKAIWKRLKSVLAGLGASVKEVK